MLLFINILMSNDWLDWQVKRMNKEKLKTIFESKLGLLAILLFGPLIIYSGYLYFERYGEKLLIIILILTVYIGRLKI